MIAPLLGGLITGGISLLGGLFGRSDAKKQKKAEEKAIAAANAANRYESTMTRLRAEAAAKIPIVTTQSSGVDMAGFLAASKAGGFNPLTFLRSGALGSFTRSIQSVTGSTNMDAALAGSGGGGGSASMVPVMSSVQVPGIGSIAANALGAGFNSYLDLDSQARQESYQAAMLQAQLHGSQRTGSKARQGYTPAGVYTGGWVDSSKNAALSSSQFAKGKKYSGPGDYLLIGGRPILTNKNTSDADAWEQRYSDAGGWIGGVAAAANDYYLNAPPEDRALMDFVSQTPGQAGKQMFDYYKAAYERTNRRWLDIPKVGAEYIKSISASPTSPGKTWQELAKDWGLSW